MLLAQSNSWEVPATIGAWLSCLAFVMWLLALGLKLWDRFSGKDRHRTILPNPLITEQAEKYTPLPIFQQHVSATEQKFKERDDKREEDLRIAAMTRRKMHEDIQEIGKEVSALTATTENQSEQLNRLDKKMDDVPDRVIATLRNTGAIGGDK